MLSIYSTPEASVEDSVFESFAAKCSLDSVLDQVDSANIWAQHPIGELQIEEKC
jgi:hypothetical protein